MMTSVAETPELTADTVAQHLRADDTRGATLQALEAVQSPIPPELALAAAPALTEVAATTEDRKALERCGLMVARLLAEFMAEQSAMYSAACGGERLAGYFAPRLIMKATKQALLRSREGGQQLWAREDAYSFACLQAFFAPLLVRGLPEENRRTKQEFLHIVSAPFVLGSPDLQDADLHAVLSRAVYERTPACIQEANAVPRRAKAAAHRSGRATAVVRAA